MSLGPLRSVHSFEVFGSTLANGVVDPSDLANPLKFQRVSDHARLDSRTYHMRCLAFETLQATKPRSYTPASVEQGPSLSSLKPTQCTVSKFATLVPIEL